MLMLNSLGTDKGKQGILPGRIIQIQRVYQANALLEEVFRI